MNRLIALMKGMVLAVVISLVSPIHANGQSIWTNPITGTNPNTSNPYTTGDVADPSITVSGIGRGAGAVGTAANDRYNANSWNTAGIDLTAYFEFTLTPDPGCEIDFTSFVYTAQASGTGPTSFAIRSSLDGFVANIGTPNATGTTISLAAGIYQNITTAITFRFYAWGASASTGTFSINSFTFNGAVSCGCTGPVSPPTTETTLDTATPACTSALISWTASTTADNVIVVISTGAISDTPTDGVAYTANATFGSGEELVLADGQYVVYNGSGTSVTVTGLTIGTTYNYAIFGYDGAQADCEENYLTGGNFGSFTTLASCGTAQITTLMVNSCSGSSEGTDELIVIQNGDEAINIDDMIIDLPNTSWCNSGCGGNTIGNSATYLADLNTMAGCTPDLFVYADPIPAGATIIIFTGNPPTTVLDYSSNCGAPGAPIYAIFLDNSSITGNFANSGSTIKIIDIDFGNGQSDAVSYIPDDVANVDGGSILYDDAGNPSYYTSTDCVYPLSVRLNSFFATKHELTVELNWSSFSQAGDTHYLIQRSIDGISFETIGETEIGFGADDFTDYVFTDQNLPVAEVIYYRLAIVSENNKLSYSGIISVLNTGTGVYYANQNFVVSSDHQTETIQPYFIYSIAGNLVAKGVLDDSGLISFTHKGVFILEIPGLKIRQKIVCL
jgi:hypothetical protein